MELIRTKLIISQVYFCKSVPTWTVRDDNDVKFKVIFFFFFSKFSRAAAIKYKKLSTHTHFLHPPLSHPPTPTHPGCQETASEGNPISYIIF